MMKRQSILVSIVLVIVFIVTSVSADMSIPGYLVAWGNNSHGEMNGFPSGNDFVDVSIAAGWSLALKSDGSLVTWGSTPLGNHGQLNAPAGNDYVAIATATNTGFALKSDGSIVAWGDNDDGRAHNLLNVPSGNNFVDIAASGSTVAALRDDGTFVTWGWQNYAPVNSNPPPTGGGFVDIEDGIAIKSDGSIVTWGWGDSGTYWPATPPAGNDYIKVDTGYGHAIALKTDGTLVGIHNQFASPAIVEASTVPSGNDFVDIAAAYNYSFALKTDGSLVGWGDSAFGSLGEFGILDIPIGNDYLNIAVGGWRYAVAISTTYIPYIPSLFANAGGPYFIDIGDPPIVLNGSIHGGVAYSQVAWDLNADGIFDDAFGINPLLSTTMLDAWGFKPGMRWDIKFVVTTINGTIVSDSTTMSYAPIPSAMILGTLGLTFTGWMLKKMKRYDKSEYMENPNL